MPRRCIHSIAATRSSSTDRSKPLRADSAWRRNWITETPGISCGYWKARNIPALARSSAGQSVTSSPWNVTVPARTSYSGEPIRVDASVLLPEPFGPMMAWTSPARDGEVEALEDRLRHDAREGGIRRRGGPEARRP